MKIPFGCILVLRDDVYHGGIIGGPGNVWLHGAIIASEHLDSSSGAKYPPGCNMNIFRGIEVDYNETINLLNEENT